MRLKFTLNLLILLNTANHFSCDSVAVKGYCGDPGMPYRAQLSPTQISYDEDESVVYKCDDYISIKQYRKCVKGKWTGENARCGNAFKDNDLKIAKIYDKSNGKLIVVYNTTNALEPFAKFGNSFIAERYAQPLRAYGAMAYRFQLYMNYPAMFELVRISLSVVNHLVDEKVRRSKFNITRVTVSPYRKCRLHSQSSVSPWSHNSTRFDYWFNCESIDGKSFEKELNNKSNLVTIETESSYAVDMDLATFILAQQYTNDGNNREPICGTPEIPTGLATHVINHHTRYAFKCAPGFTPVDSSGVEPNYDLVCGTDMTWKGLLPECMPQKTCNKFELSDKHLTEVDVYEKVYFYNTSLWFAIEGTKAHFRCKDEIQIFIGKEYRVCGKDGQWSDSLPNCLDPEKGFINTESKLTITTISIIVLLTLILIFSLSALLIYCFIRMKKLRANKLNSLGLRQSNIYDDYDFHDMRVEGKTMDETYEMVDEDRYARSDVPKNVTPMYTPMTNHSSYKYNYNDKNVYDDCIEYQTQQNPNPIHFEDSYVVMKIN